MQSNIREVLDKKGHAVHSVASSTTVLDAVKKMNGHHIGALLIIDDGVPVGIFTERDVLRKVLEPGFDASTIAVATIMSSPLVTVTPAMKVLDVMRLMTERRIRHLPVMEEDKLSGMVSIGDMTKWVTHDLRDEVEQLESYISGPSL